MVNEQATAARRMTATPFSPVRAHRLADVEQWDSETDVVVAGFGIADLPEFIVGDAIAEGKVEVILKGWKQKEGAVHLVMPPGGPRPARVEVLADFLAKHFAKKKR